MVLYLQCIEYSVVYIRFILTIYCDSDKSVCDYCELHKIGNMYGSYLTSFVVGP